MIKNLFGKTTPDDVLKELKHTTFKEDKIKSLFEQVDLNTKFKDGKNFLHKTIPSNSIESVKFLIDKGIDLNHEDFEGNTPLHIASQYTFKDTLQALINAKADTNKKNKKGRTPIHEAVVSNNYETYLELAKNENNFEQEDFEGNSLLKSAFDSNAFEIIQDLIDNQNIKVDIDSIFDKKIYENIETFKFIKQYIKDLNIIDKEGKSLLFYVVDFSDEPFELFKYLIDEGVDLNVKNNNEENILIYLVKKIIELKKDENPEEYTLNRIKQLIKLIPDLLENEVDYTLNNKNDENVLTLSVKSLDIKLLETLLDFNVDPNILTNKKESALSIAVVIGNEALEIIYLLLDYGANPNIKDESGENTIEKLINIELFKKSGKKLPISQRRKIDENSDYLAIFDVVLANGEVKLLEHNSNEEPYFFETIKYGNLYLTKLLVKYGADINQVDKNDLNILYKYMADNTSFRREIDQKNYYTNLKAIIGLGANVNAKDAYGGITLHKAILDNDINTVKIILHSGADINAIDNRGRNMVHNCMWKNKIKTFRLIYTFNKKLLNEPDKFGVLPINYAAFLGYKDLVLELIRTGSHINNPYKKTAYIINFLKRFHPNIKTLEEKALTVAEKNTIKVLTQNMIEEFSIKTT